MLVTVSPHDCAQVRMPAWLYKLLYAERLRLPLRGRLGAHGDVSQNDGGRFRAPLRLPNENAAAPTHAAPYTMPFLARGWLFNSSRETHSMPHFSFLAGTGGRQARVAQNGSVVSRNRQRKANPDRRRAPASRADAPSLSRHVSVRVAQAFLPVLVLIFHTS